MAGGNCKAGWLQLARAIKSKFDFDGYLSYSQCAAVASVAYICNVCHSGRGGEVDFKMPNAYFELRSDGSWRMLLPLGQAQAATLLIIYTAISNCLQQPQTFLTRLWLGCCYLALFVANTFASSEQEKLTMLLAVLLSACIVVYAIIRGITRGEHG